MKTIFYMGLLMSIWVCQPDSPFCNSSIQFHLVAVLCKRYLNSVWTVEFQFVFYESQFIFSEQNSTFPVPNLTDREIHLAPGTRTGMEFRKSVLTGTERNWYNTNVYINLKVWAEFLQIICNLFSTFAPGNCKLTRRGSRFYRKKIPRECMA